jgi:excinuclease ABC subunit B
MKDAAANLEFEEAARLRDEIRRLEASELGVKADPAARPATAAEARRAYAKQGKNPRAAKAKAAKAARSRRRTSA